MYKRQIYNGFDQLTYFPPHPDLVSDRFNLVHTGSLYKISMIDLALECIDRSISRQTAPAGFRLHHVGMVQHLDDLREKPAYKSLLRQSLLELQPDHIPAEQARQKMVGSNALLLVDRYREDGVIQLPAKVFEYIQTGRPILVFTSPHSPLVDVLELSKIPSVCIFPSDSVPEQDRKIDSFWRLSAGPYKASESYLESFSAEGQAAQLAEILNSVCLKPAL